MDKCIRRRQDFEKEQNRRKKWRKRYFRVPIGTRVLYIETGMEILLGPYPPERTTFKLAKGNFQTYTRSYPGFVVESDKDKITFQVQGYFNHYNPYLTPPEITIKEDRIEHTQNITLQRSSFECLITDTKLITDVFVSHLQMNPGRYWELALETFDLAHNNLSFQRRKCRYGKKCWDVRLSHLIHWNHTSKEKTDHTADGE